MSTPSNDDYRDQAVATYADEETQIDPHAKVSASDDGAWVAAWVWVNVSDLPTEEG